MMIDTRGRSCPEPVVMTRQALLENPEHLEVLVDNKTAQLNVIRYAQNQNYRLTEQKDVADGTVHLFFSR